MKHIFLLFAALIVLAASQATISSLFLGRDRPCRGHHECRVGSTCHKPDGAAITSYGRCVNVPQSLTKTKYTPKFIPQISQKDYMTALEKNLKSMLQPEQYPGHCGQENFIYSVDVDHKQQGCGSTEVCDNVGTRNTFSNAPNQVLKITWWVFNCTTWADTAAAKISQTHYDLNTFWAPIGFKFNAYVVYFPCKGTDGTDYSSFDSSGTKVTHAISVIKPNYENDGSFVVLAGVPVDNTLNGFMYMPLTGYSYAGVGFMSTTVIGAGFSTLPHEMGHAMGLYHTFKGVSEDATCSCPESTPSDITGDYCADTPPVVKNWDCVSPLGATAAGYTDPCTTSRTSYTNPYTNLMSYGTCRSVFTNSQSMRARCYRTNNLAWVTPDANGYFNYTAPPPPPPPVNPNAGAGFVASLFVVLCMALAILF
jgi:hypothetical protein